MQGGVDFIPSPYWLFNCGGGGCHNGSFLGSLVEVLNGAERMEDIDDTDVEKEFGKPCDDVHGKHTDGISPGKKEDGAVKVPRFPRQTIFSTLHDDELVLKTELFVFKNPVMAVVKPDLGMSLYPFKWRSPDFRLKRGERHHHGTRTRKRNRDGTYARERIRSVRPNETIPVYHISGEASRANHLIVVLGWGSDPEPHWIIQNSWGSQWGDRGRGKLAMDDVLSARILVSGAWTDQWLLLCLISFILLLVALDLVSSLPREDECGGRFRLTWKEQSGGSWSV